MRKMLNKKGFTLMEMLIVVAIIAILVAIAIPTFTSSLNKAKQAADDANIRSAYSQYTINALVDSDTVTASKASAEDVIKAWTDIGSPDLQYYSGIKVTSTGWSGTGDSGNKTLATGNVSIE